MKPIVTGSLVVLTAVSLTANALLYLRYSTSRPLVTVGNQVISKKQYQDALDYQTQGSVLKNLVLQDLINQAAAKAGVSPTDAEVAARIADIQRRAPQMLPGGGGDSAKMADFKDNLKTEMALENLRIQGVPLTDAEAADYYDRHKKDFALPTQVQTTMVVAGSAVDAAQATALLRQNIGVDVIARQPRLHVAGMNGFTVNTQALPPAINQKLSAAVFRMKPGDVQTVPVGNEFIVLRANKSSAQGIPPLAQIRPEVVRLAKLEKAVPAATEVAGLYQTAPPQFSVARYESYFSDLSQLDVKAVSKKTASAQ